MKYRIKNQKLAELVYSVFDEEDVQRTIAKQIDAGWGCIDFFSTGKLKTKLKPDSESIEGWYGRISISISVEGVEQIPEYNPNGWNKYPEVKPPKNGQYLAQVTKKNGEFSFWFIFWDKDFPWKEECVFRELPEPYKPEEQECPNS